MAKKNKPKGDKGPKNQAELAGEEQIMATTFIEVNKQHDVIRQAIRGSQLLRDAETHLAAALAGMSSLKDGDGSQAGHFVLMVTECDVQQNGYASANAAAKALYDEINSVAGNAAAGIAAAKQLCGYLNV